MGQQRLTLADVEEIAEIGQRAAAWRERTGCYDVTIMATLGQSERVTVMPSDQTDGGLADLGGIGDSETYSRPAEEPAWGLGQWIRCVRLGTVASIEVVHPDRLDIMTAADGTRIGRVVR